MHAGFGRFLGVITLGAALFVAAGSASAEENQGLPMGGVSLMKGVSFAPADTSLSLVAQLRRLGHGHTRPYRRWQVEAAQSVIARSGKDRLGEAHPHPHCGRSRLVR